ncbi:GNAT family N-acetyltransferase [Listeria monocytogenes]|uniref:GNAT family N-acetyltransferase n=1 Tax=Listeria monocytogenes TaxID=1639 RepID=UPI0004F39BA3|nr:GNAT family N-acetyltransferase [Listeria monocytogenes]EAC8432752.1 GNAT family N-acetyltransferase [Listeria monocytogenes]EAE5920768.1 GNAT family N-acetyltransferase [Listeria monocytogenes]EAG6686401.1 GNAT family N-acetyltransferase [Listeria monocytogenes]EAG9229540.1 GNAT family N-acetyltransferase [Listeria monocytogenes]EAG9289225.1 GNAT family N-acetyltransferase [Listeria monocytogenes]
MMLINKRVEKQDYKTILAIWEKSVITTHGFLTAGDRQFYKEKIPGFLDQVELLLWFSGEKIVGFSGTREQELEMLFIDPAFTGKGLGSQILGWLIEEKQINQVDVNEQNENAKRFYLKHGFVISSRSDVDGFGKAYPILHLERM